MSAATASARSRVVAIAWSKFQPRTAALALALGGEPRFIHSDGPSGSPLLLPLRYLRDGCATWWALSRARPAVVVAITPPVFAPLVARLWCTLHGARLVVDCHTTALHSRKWGWALPIHRWLARSAAVVTLHTEIAHAEVAGWNAPALLLPDDVPSASLAEPAPMATRQRVVVAGSLDNQEPIEATLEAAARLPDVEVVFTGNVERLPPALREKAAPNVVFTGWIPYPRFLGMLQTADVVAVFSIDPQIMNRAAFEAIGLGKPLVLSDLPGLRGRFGDAALFSQNDGAAMADTLRRALDGRQALTVRSLAARERLITDRDTAVHALVAALAL